MYVIVQLDMRIYTSKYIVNYIRIYIYAYIIIWVTQAKPAMSNQPLVVLSKDEADPFSITGRNRDIIWGGFGDGNNHFLGHPLCGLAGGPGFKEKYIRT